MNWLFFRWLILRRLAKDKTRSLLLVCAVALGVSVFLAILQAAEQSIAQFGNSQELLSHSPTIRSRSGSISLKTLQLVAPALSSDFILTSILEVDGAFAKLSENSATISVALVGVDYSEAAWQKSGFFLPEKSIGVSKAFAKKQDLQDKQQLLVRANSNSAILSLTILPESIAPLLQDNTAIIDLPLLQELTGLTHVSFVIAQPKLASSVTEKYENVRHFLDQLPPFNGGLFLETSEDRNSRAQALLGAFRMNIGVIVLMTLLVSIFVIFNGAQLSVRTLLPELSVLKTLGCSPWTIVLIVAGEACALGALGALLGLTLLRPLSQLTSAEFLATAQGLYVKGATTTQPLAFKSQLTTQALAFVVGLLICVVGALIPALRAARVTPGISTSQVSEIQPFHSHYWRFSSVAAAVLCLISIFLSEGLSQAWIAHVAIFFLLVALIAAGPTILEITEGLFHKPLIRLFGLVGLLSVSTARQSLRTATIAFATTAIAVCLLVGLGVMISSFRAGLQEWINYSVVGDLFVSPGKQGPASGLDSEAIKRISQDPLVKNLIRVALFTIPVCTIDKNRCSETMSVAATDIQFEPGARTYKILQGKLDEKLFKSGHQVLVSESAARKLAVIPGDKLQIQNQYYPIGAIYKDFSNEHGTIVLDFTSAQQALRFENATNLTLFVKDSEDRGHLQNILNLKARLQELVHDHSIIIRSNQELRNSILDIFDKTFAITKVMRFIIAAVCTLGFMLTLLQIVWERRREFRTIEILGTSHRIVRRALCLEGLCLSIPAAFVGGLVGIGVAWILINRINPLSFGWTFDLTVPPFQLLLPVLALIAANVTLAFVAFGRAQKVIAKARVVDE